MKKKISIIIPVAPDRKAEVLDSLEKLDYPRKKYETIIERGKNPSKNRNKGFERSEGEIIGFLDDDAVVETDFLKNAEKFFREHKEIDIVGGPQLTPKDEKGFAKISGYALSSKFGAWNLSRRYSLKKGILNTDETSITSANLFVKRKVMEKVRFDTRLFPGEDPKFIEDSKKIGFKVAYFPDIIIYHRRRPTIIGLIKQIFSYGKTRTQKEKLTETIKKPFFLIPSLFVIYLLILLSTAIVNVLITGNLNIPASLSLPLIFYALLNLSFSLYESFKNKDFKAVFILPLIFLIIHLSYGIGMIYGHIKNQFFNEK